jgi:hypothetical protein
VQFYIMRETASGDVSDALAARAAEGEPVSFLTASGAFPKRAVIKQWRARGIRMGTFCAYRDWRDRWQLSSKPSERDC